MTDYKMDKKMNKLDEMFSRKNNIKEYSKSYFDYLSAVLTEISLDDIENFVEFLKQKPIDILINNA